jgi:iron complex outermembrane receptor protein
LRGSRTEEDWTPSLNVQYDVNEEMMIYGTYARGDKAGGFLSNDSALGFRILQGTDDFEYQDESAESFEVGTKMGILSGRGTVNVALFRTEFDDLQTSNFNGFFIVTANAAKARVQGMEFDTTINLSPAWTLTLAGAWLDAKYTEYPDGQCLFGATGADGCDPVSGTMDLSGVVLERAPDWTGSLLLDFEQPVGRSLLWGAQLNATYESKSYLQPDLDPIDMVDAFTKVNARLSLGSADGRREIALIGRNLTDELTKNFAFDTPFFGGGAHTASIAPRRTVALEASIRF